MNSCSLIINKSFNKTINTYLFIMLTIRSHFEIPLCSFVAVIIRPVSISCCSAKIDLAWQLLVFAGSVISISFLRSKFLQILSEPGFKVDSVTFLRFSAPCPNLCSISLLIRNPIANDLHVDLQTKHYLTCLSSFGFHRKLFM